MAVLLKSMATITIKATYALDVDTVRALEQTARRWKVSKSEALRRAIRAAAHSVPGDDASRALDELQTSLNLSGSKAEGWARRVRGDRRRSSGRSESRGR
jgi:Ribbon-helix-helix protein, copG family